MPRDRLSWKTVPLRRAATVRVSNVDKHTLPAEAPVRLCNYTDVYYRDVIRPDQEFMSASASRDQIDAFLLKPDDVVITKDSETADDIGIPSYVSGSAPDLLCGYHLAVLRPNPSVLSGRFLYWVMVSDVARGQLEVAATGVTRFGLRSDAIDQMAMPLPPSPQQRAIADFLDAETARIDALITKKRQLSVLVECRWSARLIEAVAPGTSAGAPTLRRALQHSTGGSWGADAGTADINAACIRGTDFDTRWLTVKPGTAPVRSFPAQEFEYRKLLRGDLVIEKSGGGDAQPVGRVVQWTSDESAVPTNFAARLRPADSVSSRFLTYVLRSAYERGMTRAWIKQTTGIQNLDLAGLLSERWALPERAKQDAIAAQLDEQTADALHVVERLQQQVALLRERRQALITAAVTGELAIPGVAA